MKKDTSKKVLDFTLLSEKDAKKLAGGIWWCKAHNTPADQCPTAYPSDAPQGGISCAHAVWT